MLIFLLVFPLIYSQIAFNENNWSGTCEAGRLQSPINIEASYNFVENKNYIEILSRDYEPIYNKYFTIKNNSTISLDYDKKGYISVQINKNKLVYNLKELQIHIPSEHTINSNQTSLEFSLIHEKDSKNITADDKFNTLIISMLYKSEASIDNALVNEWKFNNNGTIVSSNITLNKYFKPQHGFYHYQGSLTSPPCSENVNWIIFENYSYLSPGQMNQIKQFASKLFTNGNNSRAVKSLRSRNLYHTIYTMTSSSWISYNSDLLFITIVLLIIFY